MSHSLLSLANALHRNVQRYHRDTHGALEQACVLVRDDARRVVGTYDYNWPQLADATQADRTRKGFAPNDPLLRTGEMRNSIEYNVGPIGGRASGASFANHVGNIGSNNDKAVWQELGTDRIPPRSFLGESARRREREIHALFGRPVRMLLTF